MHKHMLAAAGTTDLVGAVANEARLRILKSIEDKGLYISQIVNKTGLTRPSVVFHLGVLESAKVVNSHYMVLEAPNSPIGRAARVYTINQDVYQQALKELTALVPGMKG